MQPGTFSELILRVRKIEFESCKQLKKRSDSELSKKNGGTIRPEIFFWVETFWAHSSGGCEGSETLFTKKSSFLSS